MQPVCESLKLLNGEDMKTRRIYLYNPQTSEYSGQMDMQEHPFRPGEYIAPEYYTLTVPVLKEGTVQLYNRSRDGWDTVALPPKPLEILPEIDPSLLVEAGIRSILYDNMETILAYIASKEDAPVELKAARAQIIARRGKT